MQGETRSNKLWNFLFRFVSHKQLLIQAFVEPIRTLLNSCALAATKSSIADVCRFSLPRSDRLAQLSAIPSVHLKNPPGEHKSFLHNREHPRQNRTWHRTRVRQDRADSDLPLGPMIRELRGHCQFLAIQPWLICVDLGCAWVKVNIRVRWMFLHNFDSGYFVSSFNAPIAARINDSATNERLAFLFFAIAEMRSYSSL